MTRFKVFLNEHIDEEARQSLIKHADITNDLNDLEGVDAIILRTLPVTREMIEKAKNLKVIGKHGIGYDTIDIDAAKDHGIKVVYTPHANVQSVAELIITLMTNVARQINLSFELLKRNKIKTIAPKELVGYEVSNKTLGLVGLGNIGLKVAEIAKNGFNMKTVTYDPFISEEACEKHGVTKIDKLEELLEIADIVSVSVPLTKYTKYLINKETLRHMKPNGILINTSRGGVVDENALYQALVTKQIFAAASDVFVQEPPAADSPLLSLENFVATPHIGANTREAMKLMGTTVVDEVLRVLNGKEPNYPVK